VIQMKPREGSGLSH